MNQSNGNLDSLIAELNEEFGKKERRKEARPPTDNEIARERNKSWHASNVPLDKGAASYARAQLNQSSFRNFYDWESHRMLTIQEAQMPEYGKGPEIAWTPEARVTTIVRQYCSTCASCTEFIGNEYIRFRGSRRLFKELGGGEHVMSPTVLRRAADCDPNLVQFGPADGALLEDVSEYLEERISRCIGCITVERSAWALLEEVIQGGPAQLTLPGVDSAVNLNGLEELLK